MEKYNHSNEDVPAPTISETTTNVVVEARRRDMFLPISILSAAIMVGGAIVFATLYKGSAAPASNPVGNNKGNVGAAVTTTPNINAMVLGPRDAILGNANASVTLIEYGDYQCPFCTAFFKQTEPSIVQNYVNTGKVKMVFRNFAFLGPESIAAAAAADCAEDQNKLWAYHDALYSAKIADEANGGGEQDGFFNRVEFLKLAKQVSIDIPTFTSCIDSNKYVAQVATEKGDAANVGINSTPSFFLNGQLITGAQPYSIFQNAIDSAPRG
jgi:protein-disulfide isomerase